MPGATAAGRSSAGWHEPLDGVGAGRVAAGHRPLRRGPRHRSQGADPGWRGADGGAAGRGPACRAGNRTGARPGPAAGADRRGPARRPRVCRSKPSGATIAATLEAILADPATRFPLLVTTADHALLDAAMIADFCAKASGADLAIGLVERRALMARLPGPSEPGSDSAAGPIRAPTCSPSAAPRRHRRWRCGGRSSRTERRAGG